jgi:hypothetical protein
LFFGGIYCYGFVSCVFGHFKIRGRRSSSDFLIFGNEIQIEKVEKRGLSLVLSPTCETIGRLRIFINATGLQSGIIHSTSGRQMGVVETSLSNQG